ncbi:MAG: hypothetical protein R3B99_25460 [Polyangiales bacterium]|nr:hypothetical protein [Myxococcales bacterium]
MPRLMKIDVDTAFKSYEIRFAEKFGEKPVGSFAKFHNTMIQRLDRAGFEPRLAAYLKWHRECKRLLGSGATISDVLVMEFEEASCWICLQAPNVLEMFSGEVGDPAEMVTSTGQFQAVKK